MDAKLLETLKKLPKSRYKELTEELGSNITAKAIQEGLAKEGVEIDNEQAAYLEGVLTGKPEAASSSLTEEQLSMVAGGKASEESGCH